MAIECCPVINGFSTCRFNLKYSIGEGSMARFQPGPTLRHIFSNSVPAVSEFSAYGLNITTQGVTKSFDWCMLAGSRTLFYFRQVRKHVDLASLM